MIQVTPSDYAMFCFFYLSYMVLCDVNDCDVV